MTTTPASSPSQSCIPVELRLALYRRAVACAYHDACKYYGLELSMTLDALEAAIANEVEAFYVAEHGAARGVAMACDVLGDMVYPDFLDMPPCLTPLGESVMDAVCQDHIGISQLHTTLH